MATLATLAASSLLLLTLLACGPEDPLQDRPTRPPRDTATPVPTEYVGSTRIDMVTAEPERPATKGREKYRPSRVPTQEAPTATSSRAPSGQAAPTMPAPTLSPPTPTGQNAPTAIAPTPTPAAPTVDICNRQESVRVAILDTLGLDGDDACEEVPEERLKQIARLDGISVQRLKGDEFHGLDNLESLSLEAVTPDLPISTRGVILPNLKLLQLTFVPGQPENASGSVRADFSGYSNTGLEQVEMTFTQGSLEFMPAYYPWFLHPGINGIKLHVTEHRPYGQEILGQETPGEYTSRRSSSSSDQRTLITREYTTQPRRRERVPETSA